MIEELGDGLVMRSATKADADALANFNGRVHRDEPSGTDAYWIAEWTRDIVGKPHPSVSVEDVLIVEDVKNGCIASSTAYLNHTWGYDGIEFSVGQPEIVGTAPEYRNRGLVRRQFDVMHRWAAERDHSIQVVLGIPTYYRQFGYEYALPADGGRRYNVHSLPRWKNDEARKFRLRDAVESDIPFITRLLQESKSRSMVSPVFREDDVRYMTFGRSPRSAVCYETAVLCRVEGDTLGEPVGVLMYVMIIEIDEAVILRTEMSHPRYWREALPLLLREFIELADKASNANPDPERQIKTIRLDMQSDHPAYIFDDGALGQPPEDQYAWYVRVPDVAGFVRKIAPVLERRIASSVHCGYSGEVVVRSDRDGFKMTFADGLLSSVEALGMSNVSRPSVRFPSRSFLPILFGMRSVDETLAAHTDALISSKSDRHLLKTLFPKRSSDLSLWLA